MDADVDPASAEPRDVGPAVGPTLAAVAMAAGVGQGFGRFVFPALLPAMKADVLGSYGSAGFVGTANVAAYLLGAIGVMLLSVRLDAATLLKGGLVLSTVGMFTLATAQGLPQLAIGMLFAGCGGAAIWVPSPGIVSSVVAPARRGAAIGVINAGIGGAMVLGTQLARFSPGWWGGGAWRWVWVIQGVVSVAVLAFALVTVRPAEGVVATRPRLSALRHVDGWLAYTAGYFAFGFGYILTITYTVASLRDGAGLSPAHAANVYALLGIGTIVGGLTLGRVSDRIGRRNAMVVGYALTAICPLLLLTGREPWVAIAGFGFGALFSGSVAMVAAYLVDRTGPAEFGPAFAAATVAFGTAQAFGPQVGGALIDASDGFTATLVLSAAVLGIAALLASAVPRERERTRPARRRLVR
jgi:predicted MFS family arabinose efflux permease